MADLFRPEVSVRVQRDSHRVTKGSVVAVQTSGGRVIVERVLAPADSALASLYQLAKKYDLDPTFSQAVTEEVEGLLANPGIDDPSLEDLTQLPFVTIDGPGTRDLDQALYLCRAGADLAAYYALADPSWCVRPHTALFKRALERGSSFYFPGMSVPMLPRVLSEGILSLNEGVDPRALVFIMRVSAKTGRCIGTELKRARVRSRRQLTFDQVQRFLDNPKGARLGDDELHESIRLLPEIGRLRMRDAARRDVVRYRRAEVDVKLESTKGLRFAVVGGLRSAVELYNEQLSLMCNVEGARFLLRGDQPDDSIHPIYRIHPSPSDSRYEELELQLAAICKAHKLDPKKWTWRRSASQSLADFLSSLPAKGKLGRLAKAVHRQAIMTNERSRFSEDAARHHGVGADVYARFSAPMREVVGVFLHKEAFEKLTGEGDSARKDDEALREQIVEIANSSKDLQKRITKDANQLALDQLFGDDLAKPKAQRPTRRGTVMGLTRSRLHVLLDEPGIEVKVYTRYLEGLLKTKLEPCDQQVELRRADNRKLLCRLGDLVDLKLEARDRQRWAFSLQRADG